MFYPEGRALNQYLPCKWMNLLINSALSRVNILHIRVRFTCLPTGALFACQ